MQSRHSRTNLNGSRQGEKSVSVRIFCCKKPVTSLLNSKNKEGSLHCMLADCSRWDAECAGTAAERDGTKSLYPRRTALACPISHSELVYLFLSRFTPNQRTMCISSNVTCCHTTTKVANQTGHLTLSELPDTRPTGSSAHSITPGSMEGRHTGTIFLCHCYEYTEHDRDRSPISRSRGTACVTYAHRSQWSIGHQRPPRHCTLLWAALVIPDQLVPCCFSSASVSRLQLLRGLPLFLFPCGFQVRAWRVVLDAGFLRVCPIQPHLPRSIYLATGSCPAHSHRSLFWIFFGLRWLCSKASVSSTADRDYSSSSEFPSYICAVHHFG